MKNNFIFFLVFTLIHQQVYGKRGDQQQFCSPSWCGKISISYPFRLKDDPQHCGDTSYELACENNVTTILHLYSAKYHVQSINYNNFTIRVVDAGLQHNNCSSIPSNYLSQSEFCGTYDDSSSCTDPYHAIVTQGGNYFLNHLLFEHIVYLNCSHKVTNNSKYVDTSGCLNRNSKSKGYIYAISRGDLMAEDIEVDCHVKLVAPTSWLGLCEYEVYYKSNVNRKEMCFCGRNKGGSGFSYNDTTTKGNEVSYEVMHKALVYGFEISWMHFMCKDYCGDLKPSETCFYNITREKLQCVRPCFHFPGHQNFPCGIWNQLRSYAKENIIAVWIGLRQIITGLPQKYDTGEYRIGLAIGKVGLPSFWLARFLFGMTLFIALLIYKWRKRHSSMYGSIETYLQQYNLTPISYSYKEIKKMARGFKDKLGEGGFGSVYKGNLRSGPYVAIKMLGKSKGNGQDFINEVASIGRIHHLNVVKLIGFCVDGSKRALLYEFMPNGSLDKYIFSKDGSIDLSYDKIYDISVGVARGIAYLHHGCEMKILHFDIKPHNILLDENFTPKVSHFGLAKLYPVENSIITMTAARGTIGYMAPELFYKNIGGVSYKADVYSFGMLLMEMSGKRRNLNPRAENSSQLYFPLWVYDHIEEQVMEMEDVTEDEKKTVKKMIIVALWCIQLKPEDRPSMSKVVEMLEGDVESLEMPPKPTLYPNEMIVRDDQRINADQENSSGFTSYDDSEETMTDSLIENVASTCKKEI